MKVEELIRRLQELPPGMDVGIGIYGEEQEIEDVQFVDEQRTARIASREYPVRCKWVRIGPSQRRST